MEKKVNKIYEEAYSGISEKWNKFMNSHYPKLDRAIQDLKEAEKSGDAAAIKEAKDVYERTAKNIVVNNRRFNSMAEETAAKISHTNEMALAYVNDQLLGIYTTNYNAFGEEKIKGYSFSLVNEQAVKELAKSDKTLLPKKKLDIPKDMQWNKKLINSQMLQGILQGENIPTMAKRLMNVTDMNRVSAIRNARTMTTAAENKGRQDSYKKATEDGVIMKRIWVATTDDRTRAWHADLDGVAVDVDEPWDNEYGQIMYPGDPSADPANVYNCRCSIRTHIEGFRWNKELEEQAEEELVKANTGDIAIEDVNPEEFHEPIRVIEGEDISGTWERRTDEFDFEINDVIDAQGFDGLPKIVSPEEFDRYVQEANNGEGFIAQREYSGPDKETLEQYRQDLYNGQWYVDCSTGGAQYGQGMYCAADYQGKLSSGITKEMEHYKKLNEERQLSIAQDNYKSNLTYDDVVTNNKYLKQDISQEEFDVFMKLKTDPDLTGYKLPPAEKDTWESMIRDGKWTDLNLQLDDMVEEFTKSYEGYSYIETFTLDKSAKIISYKELDNMYGYGNFERLALDNMDLNKKDKDILFKWIEDEGYVSSLPDRLQDIGTQLEDKASAYMKMDKGSFAAMLGYDAINAGGHGESGSYTVILNRTKLIIKGE